MSFIKYDENCEFPIQNLPFGAFKRTNGDIGLGVAIGDQILDLSAAEREGLLGDVKELGDTKPFQSATLNKFMELGRPAWSALRRHMQDVLLAESSKLASDNALRAKVLVSQSDVEMVMPIEIGDYTDFYASREHATNIGTMFRDPNNALLPNWLHLPVGYHGRASSVVISGTPLNRPYGQVRLDESAPPTFGPSKRVDFELEMAAIVGKGNKLGEPIRMAEARDHIFGLVLMNDWSARDIQKWEYVPLGPFLGKNFGTTISPWIVSLDALEPFRCAGPEQKEPTPLPYLRHDEPSAYDVQLQVDLKAGDGDKYQTISRSNLKYLYWSCKQQLVHHCVNGCNMRPGDLLGTGTISGPTPDSYGSILELAWKGTKPIQLESGGERKFLADNDEVVLRGYCQGDGYRVGFGACSGVIKPAIDEKKVVG